MKKAAPLSSPDSLVLTPAQFAAHFHRSKTWTYRLHYAGKIRKLAGCKSFLIPRTELDRFLNETVGPK